MPRKRPRIRIRYGRAAILAILLISFVVMGAGIGFVVGAIRSMPTYDLDNITGDLSSFILDKDDQVVTTLKTEKNRVQLTPDEIPKVMKQAIIAIEDQRFNLHRGFDPIRFFGAVVANITEGYGSEGGSTLTQQLVKIAVLQNPEKKLRRKIQEAIIAFQVESQYKKDEILTMYLNNVYYGHGAHSLQTAAQVYFGKDAIDLDLGEAAMLAGVVNAPGRYSPYLNAERAKQRQALVLNEMAEMNYISKETADKTKASDVKLVGLKPYNFKFQSFIDVVIEEAAEHLKLENTDISSLYTAGYRFYTTMDTKTQETAETVYADDKNFPAGKKDAIVQSALVLLDPHSGEIRTLIGGRNQQGERQFNRAVHATRQPGSAFKPVAVYGPALEKGYSPATVLDDFPVEYQTPMGPKTFVNYDERTRGYRGLISMRTGIQHSVNTVAVKMLEKIGISEGFKFAKRLGISTLVESGKANDMGLSLALGGLTKGVSPLELTAAYGAFANQGIYIKPFAIRKIEDKDGNVLYEHETTRTVVMSPQTAYLMTDMLQTVVQAGTASSARLNDRPVAGKTGTTSFDVDAWFVGYTPELVGTVWMGYDKVENMTNVFGGTNCAPILKKVMTVAHEGIPPSTFPQPEGIVNIPVDYKSGLLPAPLTPPDFVAMEKFNSAYVPSEVSSVWIQQPVCADTGQLLTSSCPTAITKTFLQRPIPWTGDIAPEDANLEVPWEHCTLHIIGEAPNYMGFYLQGLPVAGNNGEITAIKMSWSFPFASPATVYSIYRSDKPGIALISQNKIAEVGGNSWQDHNITPDKYYYYVVVAQNSRLSEQSQASNEITIHTDRSPQPDSSLKAPRVSGAVHSDGSAVSVRLSWSGSSDNRPVVYYIFRSETSGFKPNPGNQIAVEQSITGTEWTDTITANGKNYYYRVIAFDLETNQQSPVSNQLHVSIP